MDRREITRRRRLRHGAVVAAWLLRLAALVVAIIGVLGGAGYIERGGTIDRGIWVCIISMLLALVLGILSGTLDHNNI